MTWPSNTAFGSMMSRITDIIVTLLPEPDSPTMPTTSPFATEKLTPSTARTRPSSVRNETLRSLDLEQRLRHQASRIRGSSQA